MGKQKSTLERLELMLRPGAPEERRLLDILDGVSGNYGAQGQILRDCLIRGIQIVESQISATEQGEDDDIKRLDKLARAFADIDYRVAELYLRAKECVRKNEHVPSENPQDSSNNSATAQQEIVPVVMSETESKDVDSSPKKAKPNWGRFKDMAGSGADEK